jgi:hypothetical protein
VVRINPNRYCFQFNGGALWTVPELLFESKKLIPALQQLVISITLIRMPT